MNKGRWHRHSATRMVKRYGMPVTPKDLDRLAKLIADKKVPRTYLGRGQHGETVMLVTWKGQDIKLVYNDKREAIITVLHPNHKF